MSRSRWRDVSADVCFWNWASGLAPVEHSGPLRKDMLVYKGERNEGVRRLLQVRVKLVSHS